jgi:SAM-dependent methyltransferase
LDHESPPLANRLAREIGPFIARILGDSGVAAAATRSGRADASAMLCTYANEARVALELVAPLLKPGMRVLEIGCGLGVLTRFLLDHDIDVTGIEPSASGFGFMADLANAVLMLEPARIGTKWLEIGAEALKPARHGTFDLIYSTNVLEHIPDLAGAFKGMSSVLAAKGTMVHACPNYLIPYEPHFGIPLLPGRPRATQHLFPATRTRYPGVWEGLNFITARRVKQLARDNGLYVAFDRGVLGRTLRRFSQDAVFRQRQGKIAAITHGLIVNSGLIGLVDRLPGELATPMVIRLTHADASPAPWS